MASRYFYTLLVLTAISSVVQPEPQENATDKDVTTLVMSSENEIYVSSSEKSISENTNDVFSEGRTTTENPLLKDAPLISTENETQAVENEKVSLISSSSTSENPIDKTSEREMSADTKPFTVEQYVSTFSTKEYSSNSDESTSANFKTTIKPDDKSLLILKNENIASTSEVLPNQVTTAVPSLKVSSTSMIATKNSSTGSSMKDSSATSSIKDDSRTPLTKDSTAASSTNSNISGEVDSTIVEDASTTAPKQSYREAEKEITEYINSLLRSLLPQIMSGSGGAQLSQKCTAAMMKVFSYIRRMKGWTVRMLDSMGKPSSGILHGTSYSMGDYDQCLDLSISHKGAEATDPDDAMFRGQYCRVRIALPEAIIDYATRFQKGLINATDLGKLKDIIQVIPYIPVKSNYMTHFIGLCVPSTCTSDDLEQLVQLIPFPGDASVDRCEMKMESEVDFKQLIVICIFLLLSILVAASTFFDWLRHPKKEDKSEDGRHDKKCISVTVSFSLCSNTRRLMKHLEDDGGDSPLAGQSVRGIFVVAVAWTVLGHTYLFPYEGYYFHMSSLANLRDYWDAGYFSIIMTFPLAIDALLVCFGFLLTYTLWHAAMRPEEITVNVIKLIVKNYLRLCIPLLLCFGIIFLLPLTGSGPFWGDLMEGNIERCRQNYLAYFGMYGNFLEWEEQCFPHLWFVSCCAQLILFGIFLCWILSRNVKVGIWITLLMVIACNAGVAVISYWNNFPPSYLAYFTDESSSYFWQINMAFPMSHFGSYAVGMLSGIFIARRGTKRNRGCLGIIGWIACIGLLYAIFLALYNSRDGMENALWKAVLAGVHRTAFALCISWIMVACSYGLGGFVNAFLSWRVFDPLFRLSYYAYIFQFIIISYIVSISKGHFSFTHIELVLRAFSYLGATYFVSYILYLLLEMPLVSLKEAFCPKKTFRIEVTPLQTYTSHKGDFISKNTIEGSVKLWSITDSTNGMPY